MISHPNPRKRWSGSEFCVAKLNYDRLRRVMSYDCFASYELPYGNAEADGDHIITKAAGFLITFGGAKFITHN